MATQPHAYGSGSSSASAPVASTSSTLHRYHLPIPPHAPALFSSTRNSVSNPNSSLPSTTNGPSPGTGGNNLASVPSMSVTDAIVPGPSHIAPMQTSIAPLDAHAADPEALKRERMAQHTKDLEAWVLGSNNPPSTSPPPPPPPPPLSANAANAGAAAAAALSAIAAAVNAIEDVSDQDAEGEDDVDLDMVPAPPKRARTSGSSTPATTITTNTATARGRNGASAGSSATTGRAAPVRKGKAGAIARKYLMETDSPAEQDSGVPGLPPVVQHQNYAPAPNQLDQATSAVGPSGAGPVPAAKGRRKASTGGALSSRRASANGGGGGGVGGGGGAVTNGSGASTGTALVTSNHAPDGPEEPIVGPDPTPADLVALYPLQPRPPRPPRARPPRSGTSPGSSTPTTSTSAAAAAKGPLLSAEQKKANHIASEQKRRAAIRKGYDGLCEVVPTLKAAVEEFEERVRKVAVTGGPGGGGSQSPAPSSAESKAAVAAATAAATAAAAEKGSGGGKRQGRGKGGESTTGALMGGISVGGEKIDGRAGPKSEAVVLTQTVEHIRRLLADRTALLEKLSALHAASGGNRTLPRTGATREWDDRWDDGMREEMGIALADEEWEDE